MKVHAAARVIDVLEIAEESGNAHAGIRASSSKKAVGLVTQMKCIYTNACRMGNKQEEPEPIMQQENYDIGGWK